MHVGVDLLKMMSGIDVVGSALSRPGARVRRSPRWTGAGFHHHRAGVIRLREGRQIAGVAVLSSARLDVWPDTPTIAEAIPGYEASAWDGIGAPIKTPKDIVDKLNTTINAGLADPALKARIKDLGGEPDADDACGICQVHRRRCRQVG